MVLLEEKQCFFHSLANGYLEKSNVLAQCKTLRDRQYSLEKFIQFSLVNSMLHPLAPNINAVLKRETVLFTFT
jgi:hypothetical protein